MLEVCRVAVGILWALVATHAAGVIHRDLKPSNIFLLPGSIGPDSVRVLDFGVAYDKEVGNDHEVAGEVLGTVRYMSPEQIRGLPSDARSDLYSLGLVMYRCVTGRMPRAKNMPQDDLPDVVLALRRVHVPLEPVATRCPNHIHPEIGKIIDRTLDIKVEDRFDSAQQMLDELEPLVV